MVHARAPQNGQFWPNGPKLPKMALLAFLAVFRHFGQNGEFRLKGRNPKKGLNLPFEGTLFQGAPLRVFTVPYGHPGIQGTP